ncbi:MAG TPA: peroxiredoxin, partial [Methylomirabilota bacterium]|nr:peroxiredoxin [Methylomirabilota bacterium]
AGVAFWLVYADGTVSADAIRRHVREYDYPCAALRDPEHRLVEFCGAKVTPEAAVIAPDGRVVYRGRIDDRYVAFGKWRPAPTRRDLFEALSAALEGRSVVPGGPAVGCTISPAE